jgi:hypothetical protein
LKTALANASRMVKTRPDPELEQVDFAFSTVFVDPDEEDKQQPDPNLARDAFLCFTQALLRDYELFFTEITGEATPKEKPIAEDIFKFDKFRQHHQPVWHATDPASFMHQYTSTCLFASFVEQMADFGSHPAQI